MHESIVFCSACTMSSLRKFTFAVSSPDEFLASLTRYNVFYQLFSDTDDEDRIGTSYIRWGRKTCENNATLVYKGILYVCTE